MINYIILGFLSKKDSTVYDIKIAMDNSIGQFYSSSFGSINPAIKKLEQQQLIHCTESIENSRLKKTYKITTEGIKDYKKWLSSSIQQGRIKDQVLIRIFFLGDSNPKERKRLITDYLDELKAWRSELKDTREGIEKLNLSSKTLKEVKFQVSTLQFGLEYIEFKEKWFKKLLKEL